MKQTIFLYSACRDWPTWWHIVKKSAQKNNNLFFFQVYQRCCLWFTNILKGDARYSSVRTGSELSQLPKQWLSQQRPSTLRCKCIEQTTAVQCREPGRLNSEKQLHNIIRSAVKDGSYCTVFQVAAAANVLKKNVILVYPTYGGATVHGDLNRKFLPHDVDSSEPIFILFTLTKGILQEEHLFRVDHFLSLVPEVLRFVESFVRHVYKDICHKF